MRRSVLVTGGSGLLGLNWGVLARERFDVTLGLHSRNVSLQDVRSLPIDLQTEAQAAAAIEAVRPHLVIHAAGLTSVEQCERDPELARRVNVDCARHIATACARRGVALAHISTDHLFSGDDSFTDEQAEVHPRNTYASTKAAAERVVLEAHPSSLVIRTNFFGWGPSYRKSFSDNILAALRGNRVISLFRDVYYTPLVIAALVPAVHDLADAGASGTYNVVGDERISKLDFGLALARRIGADPGLLQPIEIASRPDLARRPRDMSLSNSKACRAIGRRLGSVAEQIELLFQQEATGGAAEIQSL